MKNRIKPGSAERGALDFVELISGVLIAVFMNVLDLQYCKVFFVLWFISVTRFWFSLL